MSEVFLKALKWYMICLAFMVGTSAFIASDKMHSVKPLGLGVLAYGIAYIMSSMWKDIRGRLLLANISVFVGLSLATKYVPTIMYILFAYKLKIMPYSFDAFMLWSCVVGGIGIPIMTVIFYFFDD